MHSAITQVLSKKCFALANTCFHSFQEVEKSFSLHIQLFQNFTPFLPILQLISRESPIRGPRPKFLTGRCIMSKSIDYSELSVGLYDRCFSTYLLPAILRPKFGWMVVRKRIPSNVPFVRCPNFCGSLLKYCIFCYYQCTVFILPQGNIPMVEHVVNFSGRTSMNSFIFITFLSL